MISRRALLAASAALAGLAVAPALAQAPAAPADRITTLAAMKRATRFMLDEAAYKGGYVWSYLPDFSRRWGELEASPTMIWIQPPEPARWATSTWTPITPPGTSFTTARPSRSPQPSPPPSSLRGLELHP